MLGSFWFPLRRMIARFTDYLVWGMLTVAVLGDKIGEPTKPSWLFYAAFWLYVPFEAWLISKFGTTAGKTLLGIRICDDNGKNLSFGISLKRAFLVFGIGIGCFLPYVSIALPALTSFRLFKYQTTFWDAVLKDCVETQKTSWVKKLLFTSFFVFLFAGYALTASYVLRFQSIDFDAVEREVLASYDEKIRTRVVEILSENAVLGTKNAERTAEDLKSVQNMIQIQSNEFKALRSSIQHRIDKMPKGQNKNILQGKLNDMSERMSTFLFSESLRVTLFENIVGFFQTQDNRYTVENGTVVFENPELARQYDNFMAQLQTFLTVQEEITN